MCSSVLRLALSDRGLCFRRGLGWDGHVEVLELLSWIRPLGPPLMVASEEGAGIPGLHNRKALPGEASSWSLLVEAFCPEAGGFPGDVLIIHRNALSFLDPSWALVLGTTWKWFTQQCFVRYKKAFLIDFQLIAVHFLSKSLFSHIRKYVQNSATHFLCHLLSWNLPTKLVPVFSAALQDFWVLQI